MNNSVGIRDQDTSIIQNSQRIGKRAEKRNGIEVRKLIDAVVTDDARVRARDTRVRYHQIVLLAAAE